MMEVLVPAVVLFASAVGSWALTRVVRRYALARSILDRPSDRSSHQVPTPRGGGLGIVAVALSVTLVVVGWHLSSHLLIALVGVLLTAAVGWLDDHRPLSVRVRLAAHVLAGLLILPLALWPSTVPEWPVTLAAIWWVLWAVSAINVVNFMDGIDGLIGSQAMIFGAYLGWQGVPGAPAWLLGLALAGASAGFLIWNWPPAKIFLGDVGSGALGLLFVLGGVLLIREGQASVVTAFLPLYVLFLDASVTLARRFHRREPIAQAHRSHLYQRLANGGWGHARVSLLYAAVALVALPIAALPAVWLNLGIAAYFLGVLALGIALDRRAP